MIFDIAFISIDSGNGMTHGTLGGMIITDLIVNKTSKYETLYNPSRKMTKDLGEFITHNLNVQAQYKSWITGGDVKDIEDIPLGCGAIMRNGMYMMDFLILPNYIFISRY